MKRISLAHLKHKLKLAIARQEQQIKNHELISAAYSDVLIEKCRAKAEALNAVLEALEGDPVYLDILAGDFE